MQMSAKIRVAIIAGLAFSGSLAAQTSVAKPSAVVSTMPAQATQQPMNASQQSPHPAEITYTDGKLFVSANNSSLNQILRDIGRKTGMKITGGVTDERVFGQYGPDAPSKILGTLLDGTGSNMLLLQATSVTPAELILTPRQGRPTPHNPNASSFDDDSADAPANGNFPPIQPRYPPATPPQAPAAAAPAGSEPAQQSPNAVKTPQQIYEQLQRLRQQQEQQQQQRSTPP